MAAQTTIVSTTTPRDLLPRESAYGYRTVGPQRRAELTRQLLGAAAQADDVERRRLHDEVVLINLGVAEAVARRYSGRGQDRQDLTQVASIGLVKAVQRYDATKGDGFLAYAVPTITGEIKRYFRDHAWMVRPPRRIQDLQAAIPAASTELSNALNRSPSATEIAVHLGEELDDVIEAQASRSCYTPVSIDAPSHDGDGVPLADLIGDTDDAFDRAEAVALVAPACRHLPQRDQRILFLRFFRGWTQREIADDLGVTQMQVSRLLSGILARIRTAVGIAEPATKPARRSTR